MIRYIFKQVKADLAKKMVWIGGPRQVGKTTLSRMLCDEAQHCDYFNWDVPEDRQAILKKRWRSDAHLVVFDELHKYPRWKNWIKGVYDVKHLDQQFLVTGSARLDVYKRGGDSLLGRYHYWRLHPFTLDELPASVSPQEGFQRLLTLGGFPEPFLLGDEREARRWRRERFDRIIREDIRDITHVRELQILELFIENLKQRVGSNLVLSNLARDLEISPKTAKSWLSLAESMYIGFAIKPYTQKIARAISKPEKFYFYDNADVTNTGAKLENLVATHLLKRLHFIEDYHGYRCSLHYIRDKESREVDFVTVIDGEIHELIEVKSSDSDISTSLKYYHQYLNPKRTVQLVGELTRSYTQNGIEVLSPIDFFVEPPWETDI